MKSKQQDRKLKHQANCKAFWRRKKRKKKKVHWLYLSSLESFYKQYQQNFGSIIVIPKKMKQISELQ